jgi:hypothetical protein
LLPAPPDFIEFIQRAAFPSEDVFGSFGPSKGLWLCVVLPKVVVDGGFQVVDAGVAAPSDAP